MVGIIVIAHGRMAEGLLDATRMIVGEQQGLVGLGLQESDDIECLVERVHQAIEQMDTGDGTLILVDVFGASPFNAGARAAMTRQDVEVLSGVSLPILLEAVMQREGKSLRELVETARAAGVEGIRSLSQTLSGQPT